MKFNKGLATTLAITALAMDFTYLVLICIAASGPLTTTGLYWIIYSGATVSNANTDVLGIFRRSWLWASYSTPLTTTIFAHAQPECGATANRSTA